MKNYDKIPFNSPMLFLFLTLFSLLWLSALGEWVDLAQHERVRYYVVSLLCLLIMGKCLENYRLNEDEIVYFWLFFPIRRLRWDKIKQAGVTVSHTGMRGGRHTNIILTPDECDGFNPYQDDPRGYYQSNRGKIMKITYSKKTLALIQKYRPTLDYDQRHPMQM